MNTQYVTSRSALAVAALLVALLVLAAARSPGDAAAQAGCVPPAQLGIVFVIDDSGSMEDNDPDLLRATAVEIGLRGAPRGTVAATVAFSDSATVVQPPTVLTDANVADLGTAVRSGLRSYGETNYDDAFMRASDALAAMPPTVDRRAVVFISDGKPTSSYDAHLPIAAAGVPIHTIGFGSAAPQELVDISAASPGGTALSVTSVGEVQSVVGRLLAGLTCQGLLGGQVVTLAPGQETRVPFDVAPDNANLEALATWSNASVSVWLERPDLTLLAAGRTRRGETFEAGATFARATSELPDTGRWNVVLKSSSSVPVNVVIDFLGKKFGTPAYGPPPLDPGCTAPGATNQVSILGRSVWSPCIIPEGGGYRSRGVTRINGLDIRPNGDLTVSRTGKIGGSGTVGFTVSPTIPGLNGFMPLPGLSPSTINLGVGFRAPAGFDNFLGLPHVKRAGVEVAWSADGVLLKFALDLKDLVTTGDASKDIQPKGKLPPGFGIVAELKSTNATGLIADRIEGRASSVRAFGSVELTEVKVTYRPVARTVGGGGKVQFGSSPGKLKALAPSIAAEFGYDLDQGRFSNLKVEGDTINRPVFHPLIFLRRLTGEFVDGRSLVPPVSTPKLSGGGALTLGPTIEAPVVGKINAVEADGKVDVYYPDRVNVSSGVKLLSLVTVAEGGLSIDVPALKGSVYGKINFAVPAGLGFSGASQGSMGFSPRFKMEVYGKGQVSTPLGSHGGEGMVTNKGVGACARARLGGAWGTPSITKTFGGAIPVNSLWSGARDVVSSILNGCDFAEVRRALASQAGAPVSVRLKRGQPRLVYVPPVGGAPVDVTVSRPGAAPVAIPATAPNPFSAPGILAGRDPEGGLYLIVFGPRSGFAQIAPPAGVTLAGVRAAQALPTPRGSGTVRRSTKGRRVLRYRLRGLDRRDRVRIVETGARSGPKTIKARARRAARIRFRPVVGEGVRTVTAVVERGGNLRAIVTLARYRANVRPPGPRRVRLRRGKHSVAVRWVAPANGAIRYRVELLPSDGRRFSAVTSRRRFVLRAVPRTMRGSVLVSAIYPDGVRSAKVRVRLR